ncbi:MAG: glycosyl hydrolase [Terrimonas sp.]|nr:glycosyl hydrolase [Terrimonas sp.]
MKKSVILLGYVFLLSCNENRDQPESVSPSAGKYARVYTTADSSQLRLTLTDTLVFRAMPQPLETQVCVFVDPSKTFQSYFGIGGALTDAAAETFYKLPASSQEELLHAYFDKEKGIGYTVGRTNINSCDFSSDTYTYVSDDDKSLSSFNIGHDRKYKIPFIKAAIKVAGGKLNLFASPWSPPAWMKDNNDMLHGGKLKPDFYSSWANYYTRFIRAYEKEGIPVWGITIQNEPMATQRWESCIYTGEEERDFLKNYLGPAMQQEGLGDIKIIGWDHNRDLLYQRASTLLNDPDAAKYLWGIGFHWYEPWSGGDPMYDNVQRVHEAFPDKNLFFTEGCKEAFDLQKVKDWSLGEKYGANMIHDFNNGMTGFTDWNILLDETGGPNHVGNFCFAPIHGNTKTGELIYTNEYYYIGHFSKFIQPGARRMVSSASRSQLLTTAFKNENGERVIIVMNPTANAIPYYIWMDGQAAPVNALPHSIATIVW